MVPCPQCGLVQEHMFPRARELHFRWMRTTGLLVLVAGSILALPTAVYVLIDLTDKGLTKLSMIALAGVGLAFVAGLGLLLQRRRFCSRFDPNDAPVEDRKHLGAHYAVSKEEFMKDAGE